MIIYIHNYDVAIKALPTPIITLLLLLQHDNYIYIYIAKAVHCRHDVHIRAAFHKTGPFQYANTYATNLTRDYRE